MDSAQELARAAREALERGWIDDSLKDATELEGTLRSLGADAATIELAQEIAQRLSTHKANLEVLDTLLSRIGTDLAAVTEGAR